MHKFNVGTLYVIGGDCNRVPKNVLRLCKMVSIQTKSKGGIFFDHASSLSRYLVCEALGKRKDRPWMVHSTGRNIKKFFDLNRSR